MSLDIINLNSILRAGGETLKQISSGGDNRESLINSTSPSVTRSQFAIAVWFLEAQLDPEMDHGVCSFERLNRPDKPHQRYDVKGDR